MSDGNTGSTKKPHYTQQYKDKIAELEAQLAARDIADVQTAPPPVVESPVVTITNDEPLPAPSADVDPLAWITKKTKAVFMVSGTSSFTLRPENPRSNPPERSVSQTAETTAPWHSNPYDYRKTNRTQEENLKIMHSNWWQHTVLSETARRWDQDNRFERPDEAVIGASDFTGWNTEVREADGKLSPITEYIPLRELVRYLLQKSPKTFLNWGRHRGMFDPATPNPYRHVLPTVGSTVLPTVSQWTKDLKAAK